MRTRFAAVGIQAGDPPLRVPGEVLVRFDNEGRLRTLEAVVPQVETNTEAPPEPNWSLLLTEAGLTTSDWKPVKPTQNPANFADARAAWQGALPEAPGVQVRIEAAAYRGKPVSFEIIGPWTQPLRRVPERPGTGEKVTQGVLVALLLLIFGGASLIARRNHRSGRGDRRGAMQIALCGIGLVTLSWVIDEPKSARSSCLTG